jgi:hypothetical protein
MKKLNELFWSINEFKVKQYVHCFSIYYGSTYFRKFANHVYVRNFYKL